MLPLIICQMVYVDVYIPRALVHIIVISRDHVCLCSLRPILFKYRCVGRIGLNLLAPCISESYINIKVNLNFYVFLCILGFMKILWGTQRRKKKKIKLIFSLHLGSGQTCI